MTLIENALSSARASQLARLGAINVFNRRNWSSFDLFPGDLTAGPNPAFGEHQDSVSATRTARLTVGFDW